MTVIRFDPFQEFDRLTRQMVGAGRGHRRRARRVGRRRGGHYGG